MYAESARELFMRHWESYAFRVNTTSRHFMVIFYQSWLREPGCRGDRQAMQLFQARVAVQRTKSHIKDEIVTSKENERKRGNCGIIGVGPREAALCSIETRQLRERERGSVYFYGEPASERRGLYGGARCSPRKRKQALV